MEKKNCQSEDGDELHSSTSSLTPYQTPDQNIKMENHQTPLEEEETPPPSSPSDSPAHSIDQPPLEAEETPPPSPLLSDSPLSDTPTHAIHQAYHTYEFRVTPTDTKPVSPPVEPAQTFRAEPRVAGPKSEDGFSGEREVRYESGGATATGGAKMRTLRPNLSILKRSRREGLVRKASLVFRVSGFLLCLISFSVMAADKNQGWALDSFHRYKELRYCLAVNVIGFVYSGLQSFDLTYFFTSGKHIMQHHLRYYFDFLVDQILTYLLMSASSSAAIRVDDWESNWGKDKFPDMARASVALSFFAFVAFASSSLISGYTLCTLKSL